MTSVATSRTDEIFAAFLAITGDDVEDGISVAIDGSLLARAQKGGNILDLIGGQVKGGHTFVGAAFEYHGTDFIAAFVIQGQRGAYQIGPGVPALRVRPMAKAAVAGESLLSTLNGGGIGNGAADEEVTRTRWWGGLRWSLGG